MHMFCNYNDTVAELSYFIYTSDFRLFWKYNLFQYNLWMHNLQTNWPKYFVFTHICIRIFLDLVTLLWHYKGIFDGHDP